MFINFEKIFDKLIPRKKAIKPEIDIIIRIVVISFIERFPKISFTAAALPVRVLFIEYTVIKLRPMTIVLTEPTRKRKDLSVKFVISEAIVAA